MTHESPLVLPVAVQLDKTVLTPASQAPAPILPNHTQDPEQVRALEAVFTAKEKESTSVAGLLGVLSGTMVLHDLAVDTFSGPVEEEEIEEKPDEKDEPEVF
jgi:hypothetical protein